MPIQPKEDSISWDECFMRIANIMALRSKDPSTQVGTVIASQNNVVVGLGYNGFPRGIENDQLPWEREGELHETKYAYICHAEENAIYNANGDTEGCKLYTGLFPCNECTKAMIQNGIKEVVYGSDKYHDTPSMIASRRMLDAAGITYRQYISDSYAE
jgi:dCMP deaminase